MILVTGGAGFIGSNLHAALAQRGQPCVVVDWLGSSDKWRNLLNHPPARLLRPEQLDGFLETHPALTAVVHLGAISETTATDGDLVWHTNVELSWRLWQWCTKAAIPFLYASSASTYGDGSAGFDDDPAAIPTLRPRNLYAWSKHAFDLRVSSAIANENPAPPQWAGLKFFNVYGPNEYHKGPMISVVKRKWDEVSAGRPATLFRSGCPALPDGEQKRDFIWVGDAVDVILFLLDHPEASGLFNVGTGQARSYNELARAVCTAAGQPERIEFVDMPESLRAHYQSFTEARTDRLRAAGYARPFTPLEAGISRYVELLQSPIPYF